MAWPTVPAPADPQNCVLYGRVADAHGAGLPGVAVLIGPPETRAEQERITLRAAAIGEIQADEWYEVLTDADGVWFAEIRRGITARVKIAYLKIDVEAIVPDLAQQDFSYWAIQPQVVDSRQFCNDPYTAPTTVDTTVIVRIDPTFMPLIVSLYDQIRVYESSTRNGVYTEVTTLATRLEIVDTQSFYEFTMAAKPVGRWYKARFFNSVTAVQGPYGAPLKAVAPDYANVMTVQELKDTYLFGVDLTETGGKPMTREVFERHLRASIAELEADLDVSFVPRARTEFQDFVATDFVEWEFVQLDKLPILAIDRVTHMLGQQELYEIPATWFNFDARSGHLRLVPQQGSLAEIMIGSTGRYTGPALNMNQSWPGFIRIKYRYGFALGQIPADIRNCIGMMASIGPLDLAGDLLGGAGIASWSMGMDGYSQSVNTTSSPENAGYSARIKRYERQLPQLRAHLRRYWQGLRIQVI